jgi:hypothetical protein
MFESVREAITIMQVSSIVDESVFDGTAIVAA